MKKTITTLLCLGAISLNANDVAINNYLQYCAACHDNGVAGAPKIVTSDFNTAFNSAINGKGAMPPKGGAMQLSDIDIADIIYYMSPAPVKKEEVTKEDKKEKIKSTSDDWR